jgi:vacuolar-type H+-ATPase subunit F/Vma7
MTAYVIGEEEVVLGFALAGIAGAAPADREAALRDFTTAAEHPDLLVIVTEVVAEWIGGEISEAVLGGKMVQVIPGVRPGRERRPDSQTLLLSALGIKL